MSSPALLNAGMLNGLLCTTIAGTHRLHSSFIAEHTCNLVGGHYKNKSFLFFIFALNALS